MSKIDDYRKTLQGLASWENYLLAESHLPGPRGNLELAFAVAIEGDEALFLHFVDFDAESAPKNSREEFLAFCGVLGLGYLLAKGGPSHLALIRKHASDPRWRIREAVAMGLQRYGDENMAALLDLMAAWSDGNLLERRAAVAALCEPRLLRNPEQVKKVLDILDRVTVAILSEKNRKSEDFKVLKKGLAYGWSVAVAAQPDLGKARMERWVKSKDKDVRWIMKENLHKKRLLTMDEKWVAAQIQALRE